MITIQKIFKMSNRHRQHGTALIIAILVLLVLSIIGIFAVTTSTIETRISGFDKGAKDAFYTADSGELIGIEGIKVILSITPASINDLPALWQDILQDDTLLQELFMFINDPGYPADDFSSAPDIQGGSSDLKLPSSCQISMDIDSLIAHQMGGGATEYGSGYEGIGKGGGGGESKDFRIDSDGHDTWTNAKTEIVIGYEYVPGVPGGE